MIILRFQINKDILFRVGVPMAWLIKRKCGIVVNVKARSGCKNFN
jgi:hypothetical protein